MPDKAIGVMLHSFEFGALLFQFRWEGRSLAPLSCPLALFVKGRDITNLLEKQAVKHYIIL